jgi:hypothetical protein
LCNCHIMSHWNIILAVFSKVKNISIRYEVHFHLKFEPK